MTKFTIREARPEDFEAIIDLWEATDRHAGLPDRREYLATLHNFSRDLFLVAEIGGRVAGTIIGGWDGWRGHLARLATHPDYRRQGVASMLVREAEQRLFARGARRMYALVDRRNPLALPFWDAVGYGCNEQIVQYSRNLEVEPA